MFSASGVPSLQAIMMTVLETMHDLYTNQSLQENWGDKFLPGLGGGSDYVAFLNAAGMTSIDISFDGDAYPYHSCYDNFEYMSKYIDPDFAYHRLLAQIWGILTLELADSFIIPFNYVDYADALSRYLDDLVKYATEKAGSAEELAKKGFDVQPMVETIAKLRAAAEKFQRFKQEWESQLLANEGMEDTIIAMKRLHHNSQMSNFETEMLDMLGLPGRPFYKHPIFAPQVSHMQAIALTRLLIIFYFFRHGVDTIQHTFQAFEMPSRMAIGIKLCSNLKERVRSLILQQDQHYNNFICCTLSLISTSFIVVLVLVYAYMGFFLFWVQKIKELA